MNWKQFKEKVESLGVKDETEINFIDTYMEEVSVTFDKEGCAEIW